MANQTFVHSSNLGRGFDIGVAVPNKLTLDIGVGLKWNGNKVEADSTTLPLTVTLTNPSAANVQAGVNGNLSGLLDLTSIVQLAETNTTLTYNPATKHLVYTNEDGTVSDLDLSALAVDVFVNGANYNASTMVLTLTDNSGTTPDVVINLADLKQVVTQATNSILFSGTGESGSPLQADLKVDALVGNLLKVTAAGVKVDPADVVALTTNTLGFSGGTLTSTVTGVAATAALRGDQVQDLFGVNIGYLLPLT